MNILEKVTEKSIKNVDNLSGKKVILRIDVNVSLGSNGVVDKGEDWRILKSLRTIQYLQEKGAVVILLAHIGRDPKETLKPIFEYMEQFLTLGFLPHYDGELVRHYIDQMGNASVVMMENLRQFEGEKKNDVSFLEDIIDVADLYVNDAFSVSHRKHASVNAITKTLPSYFGLQFIDEVQNLTAFLEHNEGTKTLILGGAKFGTKFNLLEQMLPDLDYVLMGGALANVFLKARGFRIGKSFYDDIDVSSFVHNEKIILPVDYIDEDGDIAPIDDVGDEHSILDIGPATAQLFEKIIFHSQSLMWNGPMGKYEDGYNEGSIRVAESISHSDAFSVTGGGDTSTVILENGLEDSFSFISTGGGAMLDFLVEKSLPGIDVIIKHD